MYSYNRVYEEARNALIPEAKVYADRVAGPKPPAKKEVEKEIWCNKWNRTFHSRMDELAKKAGLMK